MGLFGYLCRLERFVKERIVLLVISVYLARSQTSLVVLIVFPQLKFDTTASDIKQIDNCFLLFFNFEEDRRQ